MNSYRLKILLFHPTGNANVRALAEGLVKKDILVSFYTCIALFENSLFYKFFRLPLLRNFYRRTFPLVLKNYTHIRPYKELGRVVAERVGWKKVIKHEKGRFSIDEVYHDLDYYVSSKLKFINAVYAYEDGALKTFERAKENGIKCLYDLPTGYWRAHEKFLGMERKSRPEWTDTLRNFMDSEPKLRRKDKELFLADVIIVASNFTKETLKLYPGQLAPILVVPYGFPEIYRERTYSSIRNRKLRLLFVGGLTQAKGIANVLEAAEHLKESVVLTIVGRKGVKECAPLEKELLKHKWIASLPHKEVLSLMRTQDVFIFPSLFEGYGLVITEAMSQGTPVITTTRTCGRDFIKDGINGWLVTAGDSQAIIHKVQEILNKPDCIPTVGRAALATAQGLPMESYSERLVEAINKVLQ